MINNDNTALMMKVNEDNVCLDLEISNVDMEAQKVSKNQSPTVTLKIVTSNV